MQLSGTWATPAGRLLVGAALLFVGLTPAVGQENGLYVGGAGGLNFAEDTGITGTGIDTTADFEDGFAGIGAVGYGFGSGLRTELELGYRENDVDQIGGVGATGDVNAQSVMGNVVFDFSLNDRISPFIGLGVGGAHVDMDGASPIGGGSISDDDTVLAYQGIAGIAYKITDRLKLTFDYRYFVAPDVELTTSTGTQVDTEYENHSLMLGLRFSFGPSAKPAPVAQAPQPAPAPAPAPPPEPAQPAVEPAPQPQLPRNFLVFFDFDRSNLTPEAREIVAAAARAAIDGEVVRIEATGHADRSGPAAYNLGLSQRRADAVKAELVRLGVSEGEILTLARGEEDPLVPTPDGVREPQNRRVEIVLR